MEAASFSSASCVQPASSSPHEPTAEPTVAATSVSASTSFSDNGELFNIAPPPECIYSSLQLAEESLHRWTKDNGFNLSRRSAAYTKDKRAHTVYYECDRAGRPKNTGRLIESERVRTMRGSKRSGCPMKLKLCAVDKRNLAGEWSIVHHKSGSSMHNHKPSRDIRVHAAHRRRSCMETAQAPVESMQSWVSAQSSAGISTASIHASILATSDSSLVTPKDISNARDAARRRDVATRTPMEALFQDLQKHNFYYRHVVDPASNQLQHLFWSHPETTALYVQHSDVLLLDCTYKTNRYNLPLLNIVAMTGLNTVLPVAQCWLPGETEEDFVWALVTLDTFLRDNHVSRPLVFVTDRDLACRNAIERVYPGTPSLICLWHMHRNVLSKARQVLGQIAVSNPAPGQDKFENTWQTNSFMETYYDAVGAETEIEFEAFRTELAVKSSALAGYLDRHWWKFKTSIVRCWTKSYPHFGYQTTSAVEGTHAKIKRWLQSSRGNLHTVFLRLLPWWKASARALMLLTERNMTITPHRLQVDRYSAVVRIVTIWALNATEILWKQAERIVFKRLPRSTCTGYFRTVNGRPCIHELMKLIESNGLLKLKPCHFEQHWFVRRFEAMVLPPRIEEPATIRTGSVRSTRCHRANHGIHGTARDPILSERVDMNHPATPPNSHPTIGNEIVLAQQSELLPAFGALMPLDDREVDETRTLSLDMLHFEEAFTPTRRWGFAGLRSLD